MKQLKSSSAGFKIKIWSNFNSSKYGENSEIHHSDRLILKYSSPILAADNFGNHW